mmetsp:Transcript_21890/g.51630  ORF Transcript_21890/g.51630 Transcript_21890/m.51630 type:complete len:224 (+) Transcript_21890:339-1010(+)
MTTTIRTMKTTFLGALLLVGAAVLDPLQVVKADQDSSSSCQTAYEVICTTNGLGEFCNLINEVGLTDTLSSTDNDVTVFAPLDGAVQSLRNEIGTENTDELFNIASYHIYDNGAVYMTDISCASLLRMTTGLDSRTICTGGVPTWQKGGGNTDDAKPLLVDVDKPACNGVVHIIDRVLLPYGLSYNVSTAADGSAAGSSHVEPFVAVSIAFSAFLLLLDTNVF